MSAVYCFVLRLLSALNLVGTTSNLAIVVPLFLCSIEANAHDPHDQLKRKKENLTWYFALSTLETYQSNLSHDDFFLSLLLL